MEHQGRSVVIRPTGLGFLAADSRGVRYRVETPETDDARTTAWWLTEVSDRFGHSVHFDYRSRLGSTYLDAVTWGPTTEGTPRYRLDVVHEARPDVVTGYRSGLESRMAERVAHLDVLVLDRRLRRVALAYDDATGATDIAVSRLRSVLVTGLDGQGALPPLTFHDGTGFSPRAYRIADGDAWRLEERGTTLLDVDGDGLDDLVRFDLGERRWKRNRITEFDPAARLQGGTLAPLESLRVSDDMVKSLDQRAGSPHTLGASASPTGTSVFQTPQPP